LLALPVSATLQGFISTYASRYHVELDVYSPGATARPSVPDLAADEEE
jgi:hypothetical protein